MWKSFLRWFRGRKEVAIDVAEDVWESVQPAVESAVSEYGNLIFQIAFEAVQIAEKPGVSGEDKFTEAKKLVLNSLKSKGMPIITNTIHLAIVAGVARLKS